MKKSKTYLIVTMILTAILFYGIIQFVYPVKYDKLDGMDIWLSGSTIKFVNMWLDEGAMTHRFTLYESFDSIEFNSLMERTPYVSYPTGSTLLVYLAAKVCGYSHIDISFLKHFQVILFAIEAILLAVFIYVWLSQIGYKSEKGKTLISVISSISWVLLPESIYFLSNVFWADQCVILWVMAFLLVEYIGGIKKNTSLAMNCLKAIIIYTGMLIDYYFWILVFVAFIVQFLRGILCKEKLWNNIKKALWYICPVAIALVTFIWQLSYTDGWFQLLLDKFLIRTGISDPVSIEEVFDLMSKAFTGKSVVRLYILFAMEACIILLGSIILIKEKRLKDCIINNNNISIMLVGIVSPIMQIMILFNHARHEFAMIKLGWIYIISILLLTVILQKLFRVDKNALYKKLSVLLLMYLLSYNILGVVTHNLINAKSFLEEASFEISYDLEEILADIADYHEVYFSFTYSIPVNPPYLLAVSEKEVHQIGSLQDIDRMFPHLSKEADKVFVIDKLLDSKDDNVRRMEQEIMQNGIVKYENDIYCLVKLEGIDKE